MIFVYGILEIQSYQGSQLNKFFSNVSSQKKHRLMDHWYQNIKLFHETSAMFLLSNIFGIGVTAILAILMMVMPIKAYNMIVFVWVGAVSVVIFVAVLESVVYISFQVSSIRPTILRRSPKVIFTYPYLTSSTPPPTHRP